MKLAEVPKTINIAGPIQQEAAKKEARIVPRLDMFSVFMPVHHCPSVPRSRSVLYPAVRLIACDRFFVDLRQRRQEITDKAIMTTGAGRSTGSGYNVKAPNPMAPGKMNRIGVKQHTAIKTVPARAATKLFYKSREAVLSTRGFHLFQRDYFIGTPSPAAFNTSILGCRPAQQSASFPSITTAGTDLMPRLFARIDTAGSFISRTDTSHDLHAFCLMISIVSWQTGQPALKISILRSVFIPVIPPYIYG